MRVASLSAERARAAADLEKARKHHRPSARLRARLVDLTTALLEREVNTGRAAPLARHRRATAEAAGADLFGGMNA